MRSWRNSAWVVRGLDRSRSMKIWIMILRAPKANSLTRHELFIHLWDGRDEHTGLSASPLIGFVANLSFEKVHERGFKWEYKVDELFVLGYVGQVIAWIRLAWLKEPNGGFDGVEYHAQKVLYFDSLPEDWAAEMILGFKGEDLLNALNMSRGADQETEGYKKAYEAVWTMLTKSSLQKITHGKGLTHDMHCGALLDLPENEGKDTEAGTFGELLRYGSVHFEQTRESIEYVEALKPDPKQVIHKGLTEP